jgi:hypothetical protein
VSTPPPAAELVECIPIKLNALDALTKIVALMHKDRFSEKAPLLPGNTSS